MQRQAPLPYIAPRIPYLRQRFIVVPAIIRTRAAKVVCACGPMSAMIW
jgi:hypothetical protein